MDDQADAEHDAYFNIHTISFHKEILLYSVEENMRQVSLYKNSVQCVELLWGWESYNYGELHNKGGKAMKTDVNE